MPRACFVVNPVGGSASSLPDLERELRGLLGLGWDSEIRTTSAAGDATRLAASAVEEGFDVVVAAGGDGTVNEVLQALVGTRTALAVLPLGTGNVWAHEVGIPLDVAGALRVIGEGLVRTVDVGLAGDRYFLLMAGVGYDAAVLGATDSKAKRRLGILAYVVRGAAIALGYRGRRITIDLDGVRRSFRALLVVVGNTRRYGGPVEVTAEARMDDGLLDVVVFRGVNLLDAAWHFLHVVFRRHRSDPGMAYFRVKQAVVSAEPPQLVQVDGEPIGRTPITFDVRSRALRVLVPRTTPTQIFSDEATEEILNGSTKLDIRRR